MNKNTEASETGAHMLVGMQVKKKM